MLEKDLKREENTKHLIEKLNSGWERLFPDNPELENVFME